MRPAALILLLVSAVLAQSPPDDDSPAFGLTSSQTSQPGQAPRVTLLFRRVSFVDFRVYRVNDVARFFENLKDPHQFGSPKTPVPAEQTWLERFHNWKRRHRAALRGFLRAQFSHQTRVAFRSRRETDRHRLRMPLNKAAFAQVPLLNPSQLVISWREVLPNTAETDYRSLPIDVTAPGVYLVEAVNGPLRAYTVTIVTAVAIITKSFPGQVLAYVTDRASGVPLQNAEVTVVSPGRPRHSGRTGSDGIFAFAPQERDQSQRPTILLAGNGRDTGVVEVEAFSLWQAPRTESQGLIYTDRPVYRPGQKVYFKGIARQVRDASYVVPRDPVSVQIRDEQGNVVYKRPASFNAFGTFSGEFEAPRSASLGFYSVSAEGDGINLFGNFQVQEYKKPEYEVQVTPAANRVLQGQAIHATIDARYFFGEPVAGARVEYVVHRSAYWSPLRYADPEELGDLESGNPDYYDYGGQQVLQQKTQLNQQGRAEIEIPTQVDEKGADQRYRIEARVTDAANREVSGNRSVVATYGEFLLTSETSKYVYQPGEVVRLQIRAVDYGEKPVSTAVGIEVFERREKSRRTVLTGHASTGPDGNAVFEFPAGTAGSLEVRMTARDAAGREIGETAYIFVAGAGEQTTAFERVEILPDRKSYVPGDTARMLVLSPVADFWALVTVEAYGIYERKVIHSTGRHANFEFPIRENHVPNVFCSVVFLKGNTLYEASRKIRVPADKHRLQVEITPDKERYRPNETAEWRIAAKDGAGKPVPAEFSLGIVDEAIYGVRPDTTPDLMRVFYGPLWNHVNTTYSTWYFFQGWSGERSLQLALRRPYTLSDFKLEGRPVQPKVRKYFPDTIFWNPTVVTGADGAARVRMEFPDSVTAWRATARGISAAGSVGSAVEKVITRKNLILRLEIPRFLIEKDQVTVTGIVHNYLPTEQQVQLSLDLKGLEPVDTAARNVTVAPGEEAKVDWRVRATTPGDATLTSKALAREESDALELPLPVLPAETAIPVSAAGLLTGERANADLRPPEQATRTAPTMRLTWSPSLAGSLFSAMDYLAQYPYGCTEQVMSSFLPSVVLRRTGKELGIALVRDNQELDRKVKDGIARLYDMQHEDGGWGWWPADENHPFMTAYVIDGLAEAGATGYAIERWRVDRGRQSLMNQYRQNPRAVADLKAYLLYALQRSGGMPTEWINELYDQRGKLTTLGRPYLALTLLARQDARARQAVSEIAAQCRQSATTAYWQSDRDDLLDIAWDDSKEATALSVQALVASQPNSVLIPKAVRWLMEARTGYTWDSTKQTASVIRALAPYVARTGELKADYNLRISVNAKEVEARRVTPAAAANPRPVEIATAGIDGINRISIEKQGEGAVYWSASAGFHVPGPVRTKGLGIRREYRLMVPAKTTTGEIVYREELFRSVANVGDLLLARVTVSGDAWRYLMIEDPFPAGTEPVEREDLYNFKSRASYSRREFRDNRAVLFREQFRGGQEVFEYLLKVIRPGSFVVPPARVEPMYQPGNLATTSPTEIQIVEQAR